MGKAIDSTCSGFVTSNSSDNTIKIGRRLAKELKNGDVVCLYGELGSGKTTLTKGIALGLGVKDASDIISPSFVLVREYKGKKLSLYHIDLYRLDNIIDIGRLGLEEYIYGDGVCVIEWAEKMKELLPKKYVKVALEIKAQNKRSIKWNRLSSA